MNYFVAGTKHPTIELTKRYLSNSTPLQPFTLDILKEFHHITSDEEVAELAETAQTTVNMKTLFQELDEYAAPYFHSQPSLTLDTLENTVTIAQNENTVYLNSVMPSALFSFIATQLYHAEVLENYEECLFCYRYTLFILNEMCYRDFKQPVTFPDANGIQTLMDKLLKREHLLDLASDLYYATTAFAILHEMVHAYRKHTSDKIENEYEADAIAYEIFLNYCYDIQHNIIESKFHDCIQPHTYMAPMCLLEFYYVIYYTGSFLCLNCEPVSAEQFDFIIARKEKLMDVFMNWERDCTPKPAYDLYNFYLNGEENFINIFISSEKQGLLNGLKEKNLRRALI